MQFQAHQTAIRGDQGFEKMLYKSNWTISVTALYKSHNLGTIYVDIFFLQISTFEKYSKSTKLAEDFALFNQNPWK